MKTAFFLLLVLAVNFLEITEVASASPWADNVEFYDAGSNPATGFTDPSSALGEPTRFTNPSSPFGGAVTPFNQPFGTDELVSIGEGGSLIVSFDTPVRDELGNPFGVDLLIFGNSFLLFGSGATTSEGGVIEVSSDGINYEEVVGVSADGPFPTLGYSDVTEPFPSTAGLVPTDFTRPVDPAFDPVGLDFDELIAGYEGAGGGVGIDLALLGLTEISFVRISNPIGSGTTPEIDAFADVYAIPEPSTIVITVIGAFCISLGIRLKRRWRSMADNPENG